MHIIVNRFFKYLLQNVEKIWQRTVLYYIKTKILLYKKKGFCNFCSKDKVRCGLINLVEIHPVEGKSE